MSKDGRNNHLQFAKLTISAEITGDKALPSATPTGVMLNADPLFSGAKYFTGMINEIAGTDAAPADCKHLPISATQKKMEKGTR